MTDTRLKEPESNPMEMSQTTVKLETLTAERKQHPLELETMREKYEAWMKRTEDLMKTAEDLTKGNELLKRELERREGKKKLLRKKEKEMEEQEMEESSTSIVGKAKPVDTAKRKPEVEKKLLRKQKEAQKKPKLQRLTMTLVELLWRSKQTRIWREGWKPPTKMMKRQTAFLKEVHVMMNKK